MLKKYLLILGWISLVTFMAMVGQFISQGTSFISSFPMAAFISLVSLMAVLIKDFAPKSWEFPAFAWAMFLGLIVTLGDTPLSRWILQESNNLGFIVTTTPLLAFAGMSMVDQLVDLKKLSWRIVIIAIVVFVSIFFICASIAHFVMKLQGVI